MHKRPVPATSALLVHIINFVLSQLNTIFHHISSLYDTLSLQIDVIQNHIVQLDYWSRTQTHTLTLPLPKSISVTASPHSTEVGITATFKGDIHGHSELPPIPLAEELCVCVYN